MLPCRTGCSAYHDGCHKHCGFWKLLQTLRRKDSQRKQAYLKYHNERCATVIRQCSALLPHTICR